jgi:hypothetical protein
MSELFLTRGARTYWANAPPPSMAGENLLRGMIAWLTVYAHRRTWSSKTPAVTTCPGSWSPGRGLVGGTPPSFGNGGQTNDSAGVRPSP